MSSAGILNPTYHVFAEKKEKKEVKKIEWPKFLTATKHMAGPRFACLGDDMVRCIDDVRRVSKT